MINISYFHFVVELGMDGDGDHFFDKDPPHGLVKRFMYRRYLQGYVPIILQSNYNCILIDGFAGAGTYGCYGDQVPENLDKCGSPIIALRVVIDYLMKKKSIKDQRNFDFEHVSSEALVPKITSDLPETRPTESQYPVIDSKVTLSFVEQNKKYFKRLYKNVSSTFMAYGIPVKCKESSPGCYKIESQDPAIDCTCVLFWRTFDTLCPPELNYGQDFKLLAFIDPFGYSHTPMSCIQKYIGEGKEIFINFMSSFVNRFFETNIEAVCDLYGLGVPKCLDNLDIRAYINEHVDPSSNQNQDGDRIQTVVKNYEEALKARMETKFLVTFEIRNKGNVRLYHMIFITQHMKGLQTMKDTMIKATQEPGQFSMSDYKVIRKKEHLNFVNQQSDEDVAKVIYNTFANSTSPVSIEDVKYHVWVETPYVFRKKQMNVLEKERKIEITGPSKKALDSRRRFSFPDTYSWELRFIPETNVETKQNLKKKIPESKKETTKQIDDWYVGSCTNGNTVKHQLPKSTSNVLKKKQISVLEEQGEMVVTGSKNVKCTKKTYQDKENC